MFFANQGINYTRQSPARDKWNFFKAIQGNVQRNGMGWESESSHKVMSCHVMLRMKGQKYFS